MELLNITLYVFQCGHNVVRRFSDLNVMPFVSALLPDAYRNMSRTSL